MASVGMTLPGSAVIHHADGDPRNNAIGNLVVCPGEGYHKLLHLRMAAMAATGDPKKRKCAYCMEWDDVDNMRPFMASRHYHKRCAAAYQAGRRSRRETENGGLHESPSPEATSDP